MLTKYLTDLIIDFNVLSTYQSLYIVIKIYPVY